MRKVEVDGIVCHIDDDCEECGRFLTSEEHEKGDMSGEYLCDNCRKENKR